MDNEKKGFTCGVVYSAAQCFRNGQEGAGELIWHESGFDEDDLAICDDYDADEIREYYANQKIHPTNGSFSRYTLNKFKRRIK